MPPLEQAPYAEGQVDTDGHPRRRNLYADSMYTPTVGVSSCPGEAVRRRPRHLAVDRRTLWPSTSFTIPVVLCPYISA
jgi:hypothetical protein